MKNYATANSTPEAFVTKGKQRVKQFGGTVYLKDGDNFEIELFNPTSSYVLAKISLDGKLISNSGLILRAGERVYLERYIDSNNKFLYSTYEVSGNDPIVKNAIRSNGNVKVEFYNEIITPNHIVYPSSVTIWPPIYYTPTIVPTITPTWVTASTPSYGTLTSSGGQSYQNINTINGSSSNSTYFCNSSLGKSDIDNNISTVTLDCSSSWANAELKSNVGKRGKTVHTSCEKIETGTVEKGESSGQSFSTLNRNFYSYAFETVEWKIQPVSQKPVTSEDLKIFCTNCGTKISKSTFKFCPNCGEKIE